MKRKIFVRLLAMLLALATLVISFSGCQLFSNSDPDHTDENDIPYLENYLINELTPKESNYYEEYRYTDQNATAMYMGGYPYYGGFKLRTQDLIEEKNSSYAVFDISEYSGKTLSFVMGSACHNGHQDNNYYALVSVQLDGKQVIDELVSAHDVPKRYTLDLTGKTELKFLIREGCNDIYVAEMTIWDGEPVITGHTPDTSKNKVQLVKELLPYLWMFASTDNRIYTQDNVSDNSGKYVNVSGMDGKEGFVNQSITVSGKTYDEAFTSKMSMQIIGDDVTTFHFNTEKQYQYLSFSLGTLNVANSAPGSSWVSVYADGTRVFEEQVYSDSVYKSYTVDIKNAAMIEFEFEYSEGGEHTVAIFDAFVGKIESDVSSSANTNIDNLPNVCKLISNIPPYLVSSAYEDPLFDGSSQYTTFSMAGSKYNEGVALYSEASWLLGNRGAHICFNLEGKFKYLTFKAGILEKTSCVLDDALNIYLDGELVKTVELHAMDIPQTIEVELNNCQELKIELVGRDAMIRPAYGIAEMVVYKNEIVEHELFSKPDNNFPDKMDLIENISPYMTYVSSAKSVEDSVDDPNTKVVYDGSTKQEYFMIGEEKIYSGVLLRTSVHLDLVGVGGGTDVGAIFATMMSANIVGSALAILAADVLYESAFTAFHLDGEFSKLTFTVANQTPDWYLTGMEEETILKIGSNEELFETITLSRDMEPQTYTVDIKNTEQLVFYLECVTGPSPYYAIYDIVVEK